MCFLPFHPFEFYPVFNKLTHTHTHTYAGLTEQLEEALKQIQSMEDTPDNPSGRKDQLLHLKVCVFVCVCVCVCVLWCVCCGVCVCVCVCV